jgi:hypothetical protein
MRIVRERGSLPWRLDGRKPAGRAPRSRRATDRGGHDTRIAADVILRSQALLTSDAVSRIVAIAGIDAEGGG